MAEPKQVTIRITHPPNAKRVKPNQASGSSIDRTKLIQKSVFIPQLLKDKGRLGLIIPVAGLAGKASCLSNHGPALQRAKGIAEQFSPQILKKA
jgi:hypothetical protein